MTSPLKSVKRFFLFNKILMSSDGALSEMLGPYAFKMVCEAPEYVLSFLRGDNSLEERYVSFIGLELYFDQGLVDGNAQERYPRKDIQR